MLVRRRPASSTRGTTNGTTVSSHLRRPPALRDERAGGLAAAGVDPHVGVGGIGIGGRVPRDADPVGAEPSAQAACERVVELCQRRLAALLADAVDDEHADAGVAPHARHAAGSSSRSRARQRPRVGPIEPIGIPSSLAICS